MNSTSEDANADDELEALYANAYVAVGQLADAIGPDTYRSRDVVDAKDHLRTGLRNIPDGADGDAVHRVESALEYLSDLDRLSLGERRMAVRDALADLAPVAAGLSDSDRLEHGSGDAGEEITMGADSMSLAPTPAVQRPTVAAFYQVPPEAADRAIDRFNSRLEQGKSKQPENLTDYVLDEIDQKIAVWVGGEPLGEYAAGRVEEVAIAPDDE